MERESEIEGGREREREKMEQKILNRMCREKRELNAEHFL